MTPPAPDPAAAAAGAAVVTLETLRAARERIAPFVRRTPLHPLPGGPQLKLENLQLTGSFKVRGAFNYILANRDACRRGVVTASSGNHGQAVAFAARTLGLRAVVVVPETVPAAKARGITGYGAELVRHGRYSDERIALALEVARREGLQYLPPYDDPLIIAGQGTVGLEIVEQCPEVETVVVPVSGGGLISGVAAAVKLLRPQAQVVGAEPEGAARFTLSRRAGAPVALERAETVADGLRVLAPGRLTWQVTSRFVDEFRTVSDEAILAAVRRILLEGRVLAEPSGAAAAACAWSADLAGERSVAVVSGGNLDLDVLRQALAS